MLIRWIAILLLSALCAAQGGSAPQVPPSTSATAPWAGWEFLLGEWVLGDGGGKPGQATAAGTSFTLDLQGQLIVRRNHSEYASVDGKPPVIHDDLMTIYKESAVTRAVYWDTEGHTIHYTGRLSDDGKKIVFLSDPTAGPRFRLTYESLKPGTVKVSFEFAPPDKPAQFVMYVEGTMVRKRP